VLLMTPKAGRLGALRARESRPNLYIYLCGRITSAQVQEISTLGWVELY
jgi:hypothetical protein